MKLNVKAFALSTGLLWGVSVFMMTWWLIYREGTTGEPIFLERFYLGFDITPLGSVIGLIWALPDGFIGGAVFAWLYNALASKTASTEIE